MDTLITKENLTSFYQEIEKRILTPLEPWPTVSSQAPSSHFQCPQLSQCPLVSLISEQDSKHLRCFQKV